ncbi:Ivy family c-type lysozyme inhibitor [Dyella sp. BiH032]|uniref:Ivy family c-type lysozyme inhibitor n=1 Tax=Dyella sp. BiH032 TaxID=3075430 RepID=UPI002892B8F4|nr:Ivy family c-type lysozyme inhibitor [Dyella sp. BiH032]WNL47762.1 Ivy family c-type lysozyme inhibitor [Dyella sp. BiH032]
MKHAVHALLIASVLATAACTQDKSEQAPPRPAPTTTATASASNLAPAPDSSAAEASSSAEPIAKGPYLFDLLQRPDFAAAFQALAGAKELPEWTRQGGTSTPAQNVTVGSKTLQAASGCKPHDCPSERIVLLYDEKTHDMWGVFARRQGEAPADVSDTSNDQLTWLGEPDEQLKDALRKRLYYPE